MAYIFVSYAHKDQDWVECFTQDLLDRGHDVWIDKDSLQLSEKWEPAIAQGIAGAEYVGVVVSPNAAASGYVKDEIDYARQCSRPIIPLIIDEGLADMPGDLQADQGVDFRENYDTAFQKVVTKIESTKAASYEWDVTQHIHQGVLKGAELAVNWRTRLDIRGTHAVTTVGLLIGRAELGLRNTGLLKQYTKKYAEAYLVIPRKAEIAVPDSIQIFLQFSSRVDKRTFETAYLDYIAAQKTPLWTILIRGPVRKTRQSTLVYDLPVSKSDTEAMESEAVSAVWMKAVAFIQKMLLQTGRKPLDFYLNTPNALIMALASDLKMPYRVFHFDEYESETKKLYGCVYNSQYARQ